MSQTAHPSPAQPTPAVSAGRLPTYYISHGGGPWPWMPEMRAGMAKLVASLQAMPRDLGRQPRAVLSVSAHWEEPQFTAMATAWPAMVYDYYGFPQHTYSVQYPAPGAPDVAQRIGQLLQQAGIASVQDSRRGFDHGTFSPLAVIYPEAQVPVLQLSLKADYDPEEHLAVGRALRPLRDEGVLIVGSGLSFHNLRLRGPAAAAPSAAFDAWLHQVLEGQPPAQRSDSLRHWEQAPAARIAHPQEDHLLPLMVALGAAEDEAATTVYHESGGMLGWTMSSWRFGNLPAAA